MERKIVSFPPADSVDGLDRCEICGEAKETAALCRSCAFRLLDTALSSVAEGDADGAGEQFSLEPPAFSRRYDHYEITFTPDGLPWELGRGSMGITYKATDTHLDCSVALKVINADRFAGEAARTRFLQEARTAARLRHVNIASVFHLGLDHADCYYAMEYIDGETLEAYVRRVGPLPHDVALDITAQCAAALVVAHKHHFIHRDIKPTNVMLEFARGRNGTLQAKLIDFGLVKRMAGEEPAAADGLLGSYFAGTPHYASPENLAAGVVDARSDIYSLGRCLWFMLAGRVPPLDHAPVGYSDGHREEALLNPDFSGSAPKCVLELLRTMVASEPGKRLGSAEAVLDRIRACLDKNEGRHGTTFHRLIKPQWLLSAAAVGVCVVLFSAFVRMSQPSTKSPNPPVTSLKNMQDARLLCAQADEHFFKHAKADNDQAIKLYSQAISEVPDYSDAHAGLAYAYFQDVCRFNAPRAQLEVAIVSAQRAISINPKNPRGYTAMGTIRSLQGKHWEALRQVRHALENDPQYTPAMRDFGIDWCFVGRPERGLPWALEASRREPTNTSSWLSVANACIELGADELAESCYRRCLETNPSLITAHYGLEHLHLLQGKFAQARADYALAEAIEPNLILPLTLKAQIDLFSGDYVTAEASYRRLLGMYRHGHVDFFGGISYLSALGLLRQQAGDGGEADALLDEAAGMHSSEREGPQGIYDLAAIRCVQGRGPEALTLLRQSIASGWMDYRTTLLDPRFGGLRQDGSFQAMLTGLKAHVATMRESSEKLCAKPLDLADYPVQTTNE